MTPLDYAPPVAVESQAVAPDAVADEMEWLAIESQAWRTQAIQPNAPTYLIPQPDGFRYPKTPHKAGSAYWLGPKASGPRIHPKGYRIKGESERLPSRAKSVADAMAQLDAFEGGTFRYLPPMHTCRIPFSLLNATDAD